jgi:hypothetical protein
MNNRAVAGEAAAFFSVHRQFGCDRGQNILHQMID